MRWFNNISLREMRHGRFSSLLATDFCEEVGADRHNRGLHRQLQRLHRQLQRLHRQLQQGFSSFQLHCNCRFSSGEAPAPLLATLLYMIPADPCDASPRLAGQLFLGRPGLRLVALPVGWPRPGPDTSPSGASPPPALGVLRREPVRGCCRPTCGSGFLWPSLP